MARSERDVAQTKFTITNLTPDYSLSGTESGAANIAAVLATLIRDLAEKGIINNQAAVS